MKITVWVVSTCIPETGAEPCLSDVFATESAAEAHADAMLRAEWVAHGEWNEEDAPYPGDWREANDKLKQSIGAAWGEWQITSHDIDIGDFTVIIEGGMIQTVVATGPLVGQEYTTVDYDTDGADEVSQVKQGDGTTVDAIVGGGKIGKSEIAVIDPDQIVAPGAANEYLDRFPPDARVHADRAYQDGYEDALNSVVPDDDAADPWADDPEFPAADWIAEVRNGDTRRGYADWIKAKREDA